MTKRQQWKIHHRRKRLRSGKKNNISPKSEECVVCDKPFDMKDLVVLLHVGESGEIYAVCSRCTDEVRYHIMSMSKEKRDEVVRRLNLVGEIMDRK